MRFLTTSCAAVALAALAGCYTVEFHETTHPVATTPNRQGPGGAEGELFDCVGLEERAYSGEKLAFGLFPGHPYFLEGLKVGTVGGTLCYAIWVPVGNLFFALPTVCTLLVEPFIQTDHDRKVKDSDILSVGLAGAFRWKSPSHVETDEEYRETALLDKGYKADPVRLPKSKLRDGTLVYFEYPGYRVLRKDLEAARNVAVVFPDGSRIRRFVRSKNDDALLAFSDGDILLEPEIARQYGRFCEWKSVLLQIRRIKFARGFASATAAEKAEITAFESEVDTICQLVEAQGRADLDAYRARLRTFQKRLRDAYLL